MTLQYLLQSAGVRALVCVVATAIVGGLLTLHEDIDLQHFVSAILGAAGGGGLSSIMSALGNKTPGNVGGKAST